MIELRGEMVVLRVLERADCRRIWQEDEPCGPLPAQTATPGCSIEGVDRWFEEIQAKQGTEHLHLGIFSPDGELLGDIQLANIDWRHRTATIGYAISRAANRSKGFATDAVRTLLRFGFREFDLHRVSADPAEYNLASRRVLEKSGFAREGCIRQALHADGRRHNTILYGLLRTEFAAEP